ncbi:MAG: two-component system response regulator NarL [Halopseudomonas sp.]
MEQSKIVVVDDHPLMRQGIIQLLALEPSFEVVGEASCGEGALDVVLKQEPDVVLMDLNMKGMDGIESLKLLRQHDVDAKIIMFTVSDENEDVLNALRNGADGYLLKDMEPEELLQRLRTAVSGQMVLSPELMHILALELRNERNPPQLGSLTKREKEILKQIAVGQSNKQIARKFDITEGTVKVHVKNLLKKMKLRSRVEAAVWAVENKAELR